MGMASASGLRRRNASMVSSFSAGSTEQVA